MTLLSAGVSAGFSLVGLFDHGSGDSFARYAASRSVALLLTVVIAICVRSRMALPVLGIAMTVVQALDGVIRRARPRSFEDLRAICLCRPQRSRRDPATERKGFRAEMILGAA